MSKLPIVDGVIKYLQEENISFSMPGHKGGRGFLNSLKGRKLFKNIIESDITEVDGVDNLHHPEGIIKEAQELLSNLYGSKKSYFLVNGSTSGNLAMIFSSFNEGDKVIVERNCHRSILNGLIMRKINPIYIKNKINSKFDAPLSIDEEYLLNTLKSNKDIKGIILTYPNYYGVCCNLSEIIKLAKTFQIKVLIDSAHGAHFGVHDELPKSAVNLGADMVVTSSHKTLPSFTQTAYLHINNEEDISKVDFYVSAFLSTSPSYMLMCSMDYARYYLEKKGNKDYNQLIKLCLKYKKKIDKLRGFHILGIEDLEMEKGSSIDATRYVLNIEKGYSASLLQDYLKNNGIQAEMNDGQNVILIFSPFNTEDEFIYLYKILQQCNLDKFKSKYISIINCELPKIKLMPYEIMDKPKEKIYIEDSLERICAASIVPYPPGVPIIMPGEIIDKNVINTINYCLGNNITLLGVEKFEITKDNHRNSIKFRLEVVK